MSLSSGVGGGGVVEEGTSDQTSACPTGCLHVMVTCYSTTLDHYMPYWGGGVRGLMGGFWGYWGLHMKNEDSLLQSTLENSRWSIADNRT